MASFESIIRKNSTGEGQRLTPSNPSRGRDRFKIMFLVTEDWYFVSHRLSLARACRDLGWEVVVATRVGRFGEAITREGFRTVSIHLRRSSRAPWRELATIFELVKVLARERPDIVHQVGLKPVIYGSLAAILVRTRLVVNMLAGMGYIFTSGRLSIRIARGVIKAVLRLCLNRRNHWLIVQNDNDASSMLQSRLIRADRIQVIRGAGVDFDRFVPTPEVDGPIVAAVVSRMLKDKGVREVVLAARELKRRGSKVQIWLVGAPDADNPSSIPEETLRQWHREGCIRWLGHQEDVRSVWAKVHIALLPSYREGMPLALLEAAAAGRPIVTTDVPGCNDLVQHGVNGFLVPTQDWMELADAIDTLARSAELRARFGAAARRKVEEEGLDDTTVVTQTLGVYRKMLVRTGRDFPVPADDSLRS